jgi:hypothetical protein
MAMQPGATRIPGSSICIGIVAGASALPFAIGSLASSLEHRGQYVKDPYVAFGIQWALAIVLIFIAEAFWPGIIGHQWDAIHMTGGLR